MKLKLLALMSIASTLVEAQAVQSSEIKEVTVFLQGAQVSRQVELKLNAGTQDISLSGLAAYLDPNSVRVFGHSDCVLQSVRHELNYLQSAEEKSAELKKKKESLLDDQAKLNQQITILKFEKTSLEKNQVAVFGVPNNTTKLEDFKILVEFQKTRLADLLPKLYELDKKNQALQIQIEKVNQQIQEVDQNQTQPSSQLVMSILAKAAGTYKFMVQYYVPNANWSMHYDMMVKDISSPLELVYKATVVQNTGEDWKKVKVNLSTSNPFESTVRPELQTWYLRNQPPIVYYRDAVRAGNAKTQAPEAMAATAGAEAYVQEAEQMTSRLYTIDLPYTILSNSKPVGIEIKRQLVPARYVYFASPKLDRDAFLTAEIDNWEDLNLLDAEANLFFEGNFQGKSFINTQSIQDFLRLSLGRDKNIVIERNKIKDLSKNKFFSDNKEYSKGWEFILKNKKKVSIDIIVEDQIPVSTQKEIVVGREDLSGAEVQEETGKLRWVLKLNPDEQKKFKLRYTVKCPKDYQLNLE